MSNRRCDGVLRRDLLRVGGLSALGLGLGDFLRMQRSCQAAEVAKAKSCILIWLDGGPSHLETFDPKVDAPSEVRGPLGTIATRVPGVHFSECLPELARRIDQLAVIRSMTSPLGEHNFGTHYLMTGYKPTPALEYPAFGSVLAHLSHDPRQPRTLPGHIAVPNFGVGGSRISGNAFLPKAVRPFSLGSDPAQEDFEVKDLDFYHGLDLDRLNRRKEFVNSMDAFSRRVDAGSASVSDPDLEQAFRLITSAEAKAAFDLEAEPANTRAKYGGKSIGQSCLLARRLIERGVPFVTVNNRGWDTHEDLLTRLKDGYTGAKRPVGLIPSLDIAVSALLDDLQQRQLLSQTLVVVMGEFGRTPKLNTRGGRDHWPRVFSAVLAGGGISGGQVIGSSDRVGESPLEHPVTPSDLVATIYQLLGLNAHAELQTSDGRPIRLTPADAKPIAQLVG